MPKLTVQKSVDKPVAQALDTVTYTVVVGHASTSGIDAFDINLSDVVPAGVTYVTGSWAYVSGVAPASLSDARGVLQASIADLPLGQSTTLTYQGVVDTEHPVLPDSHQHGEHHLHDVTRQRPRSDLALQS